MSVILQLISAIFLFFITRIFIQYALSTRFRSRLPPGPRGWSMVGCLPLVGTRPHAALAQMAKKYGPIMYLKMGTRGLVVVSSPGAARAFLKTLDLNFSNRPRTISATHTTYGAQDFAFADIGPRWKLFRKLSNLHMLGAQSYKDWADIRAKELGHVIEAIHKSSQKGEPVVVPEMLVCTMANLIGQKTLGRRVFATQGSESNDFKDMVVGLVRLAGLFNIGDCLPSIAWMDLQGIEGEMKCLHKKFDALLTKMIEEHLLTAQEREGHPDLVDILMANRELSDGSKLTNTNIKAFLLDWFLAGTDTSANTIERALAEMIKSPMILECAREEMDRVIGKNRRLEESDLPNLPYLKVICKETFRLHPAIPLSVGRISANACEVNDYYIPKNTMLLVNFWAMGRDPDVWDHPLQFDPKRFFMEKNAKIEPWGNNFELIPFGAGRRMCVGIKMGMAAVEYILGTLVHSFDWTLPADNIDEIDMGEVSGLAIRKAVPLSAMATPRLPESAYIDLS